ncbi:MAG: SPOR domain-containing protein [Gallionellaceae bacterium]|nr:SPOR domain-containing protein [Gallionellaceae bacterium]
MGYNRGNATPRQGSSLLMGILIGIVIGLAIAGGVAWYIQKTPGHFINPEKIPEKVMPTVAAPASAVSESKPRFEFYRVLTDKQDTAGTTQKGNDKSATSGSKPTPATAQAVPEIYFLQAGSFSNAEDADKLKAKLALLGMEANVQTAIIPDKGTWHRVRLGPYKGTDEMNKARTALKQNGVDATPMRSQ